MTAQDRRVSPRVPVSMRVTDPENTALGFGYAQNISESGLAVDAQALIGERSIPEIGTILMMRFKLPKSALVITARGKIVRVDADGAAPRIAMEFQRLSSDFKSEIRRYISDQATP